MNKTQLQKVRSLVDYANGLIWNDAPKTKAMLSEAIAILDAELAKPEPEPVAYWNKERMFCRADEVSDTPNWTDYYPYPLYTAPPAAKEWVGLTDEEMLPEIKKCANYYGYINKPMHLTAGAGFFGLARAIEDALRAKNLGEQA